jgi:hypothetical protein
LPVNTLTDLAELADITHGALYDDMLRDLT